MSQPERNIPRKWGNLAIRDKARMLLQDSCVTAEERYKPDFNKILDHLGFHYREFEPDENTQHISGIVSHKNKLIVTNRTESPARRIFTLAHEIGHVHLHPGENTIDFRRAAPARETLSDEELRREIEADIFAYELLMPFEQFVQAYIDTDGNTLDMSLRFLVSENDIKKRIEFIERQVQQKWVDKSEIWAE